MQYPFYQLQWLLVNYKNLLIQPIWVINQELKNYHADLENKKQILVLNKIDSATQEQIDDFKHQYCNDDKYKYMTMFKYVADESIKKGHDKEVMDENLRK